MGQKLAVVVVDRHLALLLCVVVAGRFGLVSLRYNIVSRLVLCQNNCLKQEKAFSSAIDLVCLQRILRSERVWVCL